MTVHIYRSTVITKERTRWTVKLVLLHPARFKTLKAAKAYIDRERAANGEEERPF